MERDFNLLRKLVLLNKKYHTGLIKYHCDLLKQTPENVIKTITNKKKWKMIKRLYKKDKLPLWFIIDCVLNENLSIPNKKGKK